MGNFFTDFFNPNVKGEGFEELPLNEIQQDAEEFLSGLTKGKAPLQKISNLTDIERQAIELASRFVKSPISPELQEAIDLTRATATGDIDVLKDPTLRALVERTERFGQKESNRLAQSIQIRGGSASTGGRNVLGQKLQDIQGNILAALAPFASTLKQIKEQAVGRLAELGGRKTGEQLTKIGIGTEVGSMIRGIQDRINEALFNRELFPFTAQAPIAQNLLGREAFAFNPGVVSPSGISQVTGLVSAFSGGGQQQPTVAPGVTRVGGGTVLANQSPTGPAGFGTGTARA